jgi:hypothetical protein
MLNKSSCRAEHTLPGQTVRARTSVYNALRITRDMSRLLYFGGHVADACGHHTSLPSLSYKSYQYEEREVARDIIKESGQKADKMRTQCGQKTVSQYRYFRLSIMKNSSDSDTMSAICPLSVRTESVRYVRYIPLCKTFCRTQIGTAMANLGDPWLIQCPIWTRMFIAHDMYPNTDSTARVGRWRLLAWIRGAIVRVMTINDVEGTSLTIAKGSLQCVNTRNYMSITCGTEVVCKRTTRR